FQYADIRTPSKTFGLFVLDIENATHLIAITCLEAAVIEIDIAYHFGIDETQTFLLPITHQVWAKDFEIVYINQVLIEAATTDRVLGSEFIIGSHKNLDQAFHAGGYGRKIENGFGIGADQTGFTPVALVAYNNFFQCFFAFDQTD